MVKNATTAESNLAILEGYFNKYPEVPKETILKQHMLSLGHWFSDAALDASEGALVKSYRLFSYDLVPMSYFKRNEHRRVPEHFVLINGPHNMRPVAIQTSLSPDSPYLVDVVDGRLVLTVDGHVVSEVRIPKTPDYYFKSLPDGTPYHEVVAFASFITIFRNCQYWGAKEECKFCDINENARQMKLSRDFTLTAPVKSVEDVVTVCKYVANDTQKIGASQGFVLSGGTITKTLHGKSEADFYVEYIQAIKNIGTNPRITFEVNARPREEVKRYKDAGADHISKTIRLFRDQHAPGWLRTLTNLTPENYLRVLANAACAIGNSSSFVRDASFFGTPVVLVGTRQDGRETDVHVTRVPPVATEVAEAAMAQLRHGRYAPSTLYGDGRVAERIADVVATLTPYKQKRLAYEERVICT